MPANCNRHIWGVCLGPPLHSLHRGGYFRHPQPAPQQTGDSRRRLRGGLVPGWGDSFPLSGLWTESLQQNRGLQVGRASDPRGPRQQEGSEGGKGMSWSAGTTYQDFLQARPSAFP